MAAPRALPAKSNDSTLVTGLVFTVMVLVAALIVGGYWMQTQRDQSAQRQQADVYSNYLRSTQDTPAPSVTPAMTARNQEVAQAQETRKYLLAHPAVTPGTGFDKPGVQNTGKTIVQAIDQAKGL